MSRGDQHPFTPAPREPEPWPGYSDDPHVIRWRGDIEHTGIGHPLGMDSQLIFDVTEAKHRAYEEKRAREEHERDLARGFRLGFGEYP